MPIFHFHTAQTDKETHGSTVEMPNFSAARKAATDYAGDLLKELDGEIFEHDLSVEITDESGLLLWLVMVTGVSGPAAPELRASRSAAQIP